MKARVLTVVCVLAIFICGVKPAAAQQDDLDMAADVLVVRPGCFLATIVGSALFVISLPIAATSHSVDRTAHWFVERPARATFTRPIGDIQALYQD
jgi:hypothetical protein